MSESIAVSWDESLVRHSTWMRSLVRGRLGEGAHVDDVLSEVMVDALRNRSSSSTIEKPQAWLYRLTIRKVLQYRRKQGRQRNLTKRWAERSDVREEDVAQETPLEVLLGTERRTRVRRILHRLPGRDADLLVLKYVQNWSYQQISESLGIDKARLAHRLRAARQRFRTLLVEMQESKE